MVILALFLDYLRSGHQYFTPQNDRFSGVCARSARGRRDHQKPRNLQEYTGPSPGRPAGPGSWTRPFLRLVCTIIYAQEVNILGSKKPLFLGGNWDYFGPVFGPKNARIYGFPGNFGAFFEVFRPEFSWKYWRIYGFPGVCEVRNSTFSRPQFLLILTTFFWRK